MKKVVITPFAICLGALLLLAGITAINGLFINNTGGNSLGGGIAFLFAVVIFIALIIEQSLARRLKQNSKTIWIVESVIILVVIWLCWANDFEFSIG